MAAEKTELLSAVIKTRSFVHPTVKTKIYKDECAFCFKTPFWEDGVFINLNSYHSFCREHAELYAKHTGFHLFLQLESRKTNVEEPPRVDGEPTTKMTKLTIDAEPKFEFEDKYSLVIHPDYATKIELDDKCCDTLVSAVEKVKNATSAERLAALNSVTSAWDADVKLITKHANLVQHENGKKVPMHGWKCEAEGCTLEDNLWLNLTDGAVRCGRSQYVADGQRIAGNSHMKAYYEETKYPLVVKLGTINEQLDNADVYCYDENDSVIDPNLEKHLIHFGLYPSMMEKTVKSTMEMELDMNEKWEWARCQEDGAVLEPIYGPGYTGLINTGSSCYLNTVLQAMIQIDAIRKYYGDGGLEIMLNAQTERLHTSFEAQMAKVVMGMCSGDYSKEDDTTHNTIKPLQFKRVAAGNHHEFATAKQQDVEEYIRHLLEKMTENCSSSSVDPTYSLRFQTWNRFEDVASSKVRYSEQEEVLLHLPILQGIMEPIEGADNKFRVDMHRALEMYFGKQFVDGYRSPITGEVKGATNTLTLKTFPDYLFVQVQKFAFTNDGQQKKLDLEFEVAETLDLSAYRGHGKLASEEALPDDSPATTTPQVPDNVREVASQLVVMGFSENACLKAAYFSNGNAEVATNWLMENLDDPTLNDELRLSTLPASREVDPARVERVVEMGFAAYQARHALKHTNGNVEEAVDWLFNNMDNIPPESAEEGSSTEKPARQFIDGSEKYQLIGCITHMGSRPDSGHYVAHMLKDDKWVLFNDEKVALSQDPPKKLAYVYLYKRI